LVCTACATCCFSNLSTIDIAYDLDTVTASSGLDFDNAYLTGGTTGVPWAGDESTTGWREAGYGTIPEKWTAGPTCESFPAWETDSLAPDGGDALDAYQVQISIADGDCCGVDGLVADISVQHLERATAEDEWVEVASRSGTGILTITVNNNDCCYDGAACQETAGDCAGECPEI
jgi:hypothetical protein